MMTSFLTIWRPNVRESIDGAPLVTRSPELFTEFPYDRLPSNPGLAFFLRPEVVVALILLYIVSEKPIEKIRDAIGLRPTSQILRGFVALHNLSLTIFSAIVAYNAWPIVMQHCYEHGFYAVYCDTDGSLWSNGLGAWATIFYLSKYYELIDSWILVLKGKKVSFLQTYHHAGIIATMYGGVASQSAWLLVVVLLNSVIHTVMYTYFFLKTFHVEIKSAKYLTMAQIGQFLLGIGITAGVLVMGDSCDTQSSRFSLACLQVYAYGLVALFWAFANKKYKKS